MSFGEFLTAPGVWPFSVAILLFAVITVVEIVLVATGLGGDAGLDLDLPTEGAEAVQGAGHWLMDWLAIGRVPYLVTLAAFLLVFGVLGLLVQDLQLSTLKWALPSPVVAVGVAFVTLPVVRAVNVVLGRVWPKDVETTAVSIDSLVGHEGVVVLGTVTATSEGQIRVRDEHGRAHHGMALADAADQVLPEGERVLLVGRRGAYFLVIRHPNPSTAVVPT